jgi:CDP-paratose 2-epimerase
MPVAIVTGSAGLVGAESVRFLCDQGFEVAGIDNDMRQEFFGPEASTRWSSDQLRAECSAYSHHGVDIRDFDAVRALFREHEGDIALVIHAAAQPSHDWAARAPLTDFGVNATGTLNVLECARQMCPEAPFIFTSTNKVYGDTPNALPLVEQEFRWELEQSHLYYGGIPETMSIDASTHSVFGASKVAADVLVQEYGRYFGMKTACFRAGCLTGPGHSSAELHGFLAYLMKCCATGREYRIFGYKGKQVRDNLHSSDLVQAFYRFYQNPRSGEVYNMGGGRYSHCSVLEAIALCEEIAGKKLATRYVDENRLGDHIWWVSGLQRFASHYPGWRPEYDVRAILAEIYARHVEGSS